MALQVYSVAENGLDFCELVLVASDEVELFGSHGGGEVGCKPWLEMKAGVELGLWIGTKACDRGNGVFKCV